MLKLPYNDVMLKWRWSHKVKLQAGKLSFASSNGVAFYIVEKIKTIRN